MCIITDCMMSRCVLFIRHFDTNCASRSCKCHTRCNLVPVSSPACKRDTHKHFTALAFNFGIIATVL